MSGASREELLAQVGFLEAEVAELRTRIAEVPLGQRRLDARLAEAERTVAGLSANNERLVATLREARDQITTLKSEVDRLAQPPAGFGTFLELHDDGTVDVVTGGRKLRVNVSPGVQVEELLIGQEVLLNEALNVVEALAFETVGDVVMVKELMHLLDEVEEATDTGDEFETMLSELNVPSKEKSPQTLAELKAFWMALGVLCPENIRLELQREREEGRIDDYSIALRLRIPEAYVHNLFTPRYSVNIQAIIGG